MVLGVNGWDEPKPVIAAYQEKNNFKHRLLLMGGEVARTYGIDLYPTCVWIDQAGVIVDIQRGATQAKVLEAKTEKLLAAPSAP